VALAWITAVGILYPWNAKFGYLSSQDAKYPMHYVPEVLIAGFVVMGALEYATKF